MSRISRLTALLFVLALGFQDPTLSAAPAAPATTDDSTDLLPDKLDLVSALRYALDHNYTIREARERIREQDGIILQVRAELLPHAGVSAEYTFSDKSLGGNLSTPDTTQDLQYWSLGITITQMVYSGGEATSSLSAQKNMRQAAVLDLESVLNDALLDVRTCFYNVLLTREQIRVQEENIELLNEQYVIAKNRYDAGASSSFDVLRAQVAVANAKPGLIRARNDYRNAIDLLRHSLGYTGSKNADVEEMPDIIGELNVTPATFDLASAIEAARENRPELKRLERLIEAGESGVNVAKAGYKPSVSVYGSYTIERNMIYGYNPDAPDPLSTVNINNFGREINGWGFGVEGSWDVFDSRATAGKVVQARSRLDQARLQDADATLAIEVEVREAFSSYQEAGELVDAAKQVTSQAEEALRLANSRYAAGTATQLDVLTTQVALTDSRMNQLQANYSYVVAVANLRKAMGQSDQIFVSK